MPNSMAIYAGGVSEAVVDAKVATHAAISPIHDPAANLEKVAQKAQPSGYASLGADGFVPDAELDGGDVAAHIAASDPHTQYQRESEKAQPSGYASLGADGFVPDAELNGGDVAAHIAASDPHTQYQRESEKAQPSGYASLDPSSLVIQLPADATSTPAANKIPIADANALLDAWISQASPTVRGLLKLAGQLGGTPDAPYVTGIRETGGPTLLPIAGISPGEYLVRHPASDLIVGSAGPAIQMWRLAADLTNNSNTALVSIWELALTATQWLQFIAVIIWQSTAATSGIRFDIDGPSSPNYVSWLRETALSAAAGTDNYQTRNLTAYLSDAATASIDTANANRVAQLSGSLINGPNPGTFKIQFQPEVNGQTATIKAGSFLIYLI